MSAHAQARRIVDLEGRRFVVMIDHAGPRSIKVRKTLNAGRPWESMYDSPYWHRSHAIPGPGRQGRGKSIVRQVLEAAGFDPAQVRKEPTNGK